MKKFIVLFIALCVLMVAQLVPAMAVTADNIDIASPALMVKTGATLSADQSINCATCHETALQQQAIAAPSGENTVMMAQTIKEEDVVKHGITNNASMAAEHVPKYNDIVAVQAGTMIFEITMVKARYALQTDEGNIPRTMTGRFAGAATIATFSEMTVNQAGLIITEDSANLVSAETNTFVGT